jgi:hypothetical protein
MTRNVATLILFFYHNRKKIKAPQKICKIITNFEILEQKIVRKLKAVFLVKNTAKEKLSFWKF